MRKQALVIGLGQFGLSLSRALTDRGVDVFAVDRNPSLVELAADFAAEAVVFDAIDEEALARSAPQRRDVCVVAIGNEAREGSILVTALLRQMGAPRVVARATDDLHERILKLVGAHEVVNPERAFGERLATRLAYAGVLEQAPLGDDLAITELRTPTAMVGRTLLDLKLPRRFGVTVVAVRRSQDGRGKLLIPRPDEPLQTEDILVVVAPPGAVTDLLERL
jgi:trk system potassium uptake protein TrkA